METVLSSILKKGATPAFFAQARGKVSQLVALGLAREQVWAPELPAQPETALRVSAPEATHQRVTHLTIKHAGTSPFCSSFLELVHVNCCLVYFL